MKLKHVALFEELDLHNFLDDPESELAKNSNGPDITEGDYVKTHKGIGQVLELDPDFLLIQLTGSNGQKVKVSRSTPIEKITPPAREESQVNVKGEMNQMATDMISYLKFLNQDPDALNINAASSFMEDTLVDIIDLKGKDPDVIRDRDFDTIWHGAVSLGDMIVSISPSMKDQIDGILNKFEEIGTER